MYLDKHGTEEDPGPYWRTSYPWLVPREDLVYNLPASIKINIDIIFDHHAIN